MNTPLIEQTIRTIHDQIVSRGRLDLVTDLYAEDFVFTGREGTGTREEVRTYIDQWRQAFPDLHSVVERVVVDGNTAFWADSYSGTHSGDWGDQRATGRRVEGILSMNEGTFNQAGQLLTHRMVTDEINERMQLGLLPSTPVLGMS